MGGYLPGDFTENRRKATADFGTCVILNICNATSLPAAHQ